MAKKVKILFTGLSDAKFKMGDKMSEVLRKAVKKHGKENVSLVHGGNEKSIIDTNIKKLAGISGVNVLSDSLDYSKKNAAGTRSLKRTRDPNLIHYSFDSKSNLTLKDKHEDWARSTYKKLGEETMGKGGPREVGRFRFSKNKYKKDSTGKVTNKLLSKSTSDTSKFKSFLDILEDEDNPQKVASGIRYAEKLSEFTKQNRGFALITEKNSPRIKYIKEGKGIPTGKTEYTTIDEADESPFAKPRTKLINEKNKLKRIKLEDIAGIKKRVYIDETVGDTNDAGLSKLPFKAKNIGTIFTGKLDKAPPKGVSPTYLDAPPKKFAGGPETFSKSSSLSQFENVEHAEPAEHIEAKRKDLQDVKIKDIGIDADKTKSGVGFRRHKQSYGKSVDAELKIDIKDLEGHIKKIKSVQRKNKRIIRTGNKQATIGRNSKSVKSLLTTVPDALKYDKQSATTKNVPKPQIYRKTKTANEKRIRADIKKGPFLGAFSLFSTLLSPIVAHKKAKKDLGRNPTTLEALNYTLPSFARKKQSRYTDPI